jgi:Methyltransferase domain
MARSSPFHPLLVLVPLGAFVLIFLYNNVTFSQLIVTVQDDVTVNSTNCSQNPVEDWNSISADQMSNEQMLRYLHWSNSQSCSMAYDFGGVVVALKPRAIDGQKTVCMDPGVVPESTDCLVYSFGINNEWSFDRMFEHFGCQVYAFDPSMYLTDRDVSMRIHFFKLGLSGADTDHGPMNWKLRTLDAIYRTLQQKHGPKVIDYLKIDIEGSEWSSLQQILQSGMLDKVKQLGVEVHFTLSLPEFRDGIRILKALEDYGMVRFSSRANIWTKQPILGLVDYTAYEITWYNSKFKNSTPGGLF